MPEQKAREEKAFDMTPTYTLGVRLKVIALLTTSDTCKRQASITSPTYPIGDKQGQANRPLVEYKALNPCHALVNKGIEI